ncbi:MAG: amidohydrolase family protein [candidate division WS1 bacterium]|jgi:predicted TIM-barrel fold metal-dependent hydrolase|nr:amidohydrolase family protein [candidate division WS1 bacterium]
MADIHYFDAFCVLGRSVRTTEGLPETPEQILAAMDHAGIHEALVVDALAMEANPLAGNERLLATVRNHPRLHPAWCGLMSASRELPPPDELVARMREEGVGALFLFHGLMDLSLASWAIDDLLAALEAARVPLFISPDHVRDRGKGDMMDWNAVLRICRDLPDLPVIATEPRNMCHQRTAYAALDAAPNLRLDLAPLWRAGMIEFICEHWSAERLLFSAGLPAREPAAPKMQLDWSAISEDELAQIAGGNLRELLAWNENVTSVAEQVTFPAPVDELHRKAREREDISGEGFMDCHGHLGQSSPNHVNHLPIEGMIAEMDRCGMEHCLVFGLEGVLGDETWCNDYVADAVSRHPDRFTGFTLVNFHHGEAALRAELERGYEMGLRGVKIINSYQGYPTEGPLIDVAVEFCHERGLFALNHDWGSARQIERLCTRYPDACFITGHATGGYAGVTRRVPNLFISTCPFHSWRRPEQFVALYGADRLLFASDLTDLPIAWGIGPIMYARISEEDKRKILGANLRELVKRYSRP